MIINKHAMRQNNRQSILRHVINYGPISRSKISRDLSINKVTVSSILEELLAEKYVINIGEGQSTKSGGRKPLLIEFNGNFGYFINLLIGKDYLGIMCTFANGQVNRFEETSTANLTDEQIRALICHKIENFAIKNTTKGLMGISIVLHMKVFQNEPEHPVFANFDIKQVLADTFKVPVYLVDMANAAAIAQRDFSSNNVKDMVCVTINETISAGVIIDEQLYMGNQGSAGSVNNMNFLIIHDGNKEPTIASPVDYCTQDAVLKEVSKQDGLNNLSIPEVSKLYMTGNQKVIAAVNRFVISLCLVLNNLIASYSPQLLILDSTLIEHLPFLLIQIKNKLPILSKTKTRLQIARESRMAPFQGGYSVLLRETFNLGDKRLRLIP